MKICAKCILPETFPGISFNEEGVCNFCLEFKGVEHLEKRKEEYRKKFEILVKEYKGKNTYDALMCYSGGKDSTYTLEILNEDYKLNILAFTMDNGFVPEQTFKNIRDVVGKLGIDHIFLKPSFKVLKKIFKACAKKNIYPAKTLERASAICTSCMGIVKFSALRLALEKSIPFIIFGWSPGQASISSSIMKNNPQMVKMMQNVVYGPLYKIAGEDIKPYFLENKYYNGTYNFPYNINPLAFWQYNEGLIYKKIAKLGWLPPKETDASSTNCLLNSFAIIVHKKQYNFHPYALEKAKLVREGYLYRKTAIAKINSKEDGNIVNLVKQKLGL